MPRAGPQGKSVTTSVSASGVGFPRGAEHGKAVPGRWRFDSGVEPSCCRPAAVAAYAESCENSRCAKYGLETPEIQGLRDLKPVICNSCGYLLVPDVLAEAFRGMNHD